MKGGCRAGIPTGRTLKTRAKEEKRRLSFEKSRHGRKRHTDLVGDAQETKKKKPVRGEGGKEGLSRKNCPRKNAKEKTALLVLTQGGGGGGTIAENSLAKVKGKSPKKKEGQRGLFCLREKKTKEKSFRSANNFGSKEGGKAGG